MLIKGIKMLIVINYDEKTPILEYLSILLEIRFLDDSLESSSKAVNILVFTTSNVFN